MSGGLVAGIVLRAIRESIGHTQEQLAEVLEVDSNTIKGWETGRRALINASGRTLFGLRRRLLGLGASADLVGHLDTAMDADMFIAQTLEAGTADSRPMLGTWVATRTWSDLLSWVLADTPPSLLRGHLGQVPRSQLPAADRRRFFDIMRDSAERARSDSPESMLLRRQVYYMAAWDPSPEGRDWLAGMERAELRRVRRNDGWTPAWPLLRSTAVARACQGDPTLLNDFMAEHLADDLCEAANLNYWSYWVEETTGTATSDAFMATDLGRWNGSVLLDHLSAGLSMDVPYVALSVHATSALVERRPALLQDPVLARRLGNRVTALLDSGNGVPAQTRRELDNINYAVKMAAATARRTDA